MDCRERDSFGRDEVAFAAVWRKAKEVSKVSVERGDFAEGTNHLGRALHTHLQAKAAKDYEPLQMHYAANLIRNLAGNPTKHMDYAKE